MIFCAPKYFVLLFNSETISGLKYHSIWILLNWPVLILCRYIINVLSNFGQLILNEVIIKNGFTLIDFYNLSTFYYKGLSTSGIDKVWWTSFVWYTKWKNDIL